jgi:Tol biopolymer transport system component
MRRVPAALLLCVGALLVAPAVASATLVYSTYSARAQPSLWSANNDGTGAIRIGSGYYQPIVSPDGTQVAAFRQTRSGSNRLYVMPTTGGPATQLIASAGSATVAWSPDSTTLAAVTGRRLVAITLADGAVTTLATGFFNGSALSFSPGGDAIAYSAAVSSRVNAKSDVYTVPLAGGGPTRLTFDGLSLNPVWGPAQIAYSKGPQRRQDYPRLQIWLMNPDGSDQRQLTSVRVGRLVSGLSPMEWSASGAQLLADYTGEDTSQAFAVDPLTGVARDLGASPFDGTVPAAISRDGTTVLAQTGGQEGPSPDQNVVTIPFDGGPPTVLVPRGLTPDWNA